MRYSIYTNTPQNGPLKPNPMHFPTLSASRSLRRVTRLLLIVTAAAGLAACQATAPIIPSATAAESTNGSMETRFGFTPFPYDSTPKAVARTQKIVEDAGNLYALHFDGCIPWRELIDNEPFPRYFQDDWTRLKNNIPADDAVYVGIAPLAKDRRTPAPACAARQGEAADMPRELRDARLDNPVLMAAYLRFVQRAVAQFEPDFLNVGIEVDGLAAHEPRDWQRFEKLFDHVRVAIKREHPTLPIGVSMNPQMLMDEKVGERAHALVERSDYLGLSFYPYASPMAERYGAPPLGSGDERWTRVFDWAARYTDKPVGICETAFITNEVYLKQYDLRMRGDVPSQTKYVRALVNRAKADGYLFVVWFLAVDYDKLYARMPDNPGKEVNLLWRNSGLLDGELRPKPAFAEWKRAVDGAQLPAAASVAAPAPSEPASTSPGARIGFAGASDLFGCPGDDVALDPEVKPANGGPSMRWRFRYGGDWKWCAREVDGNSLKDADSLSLWVRSDAAGPLFLTIEERGGEAFFAVLEVGATWKRIELQLSDLSVDKNKRRDGQLTAEKISKLVLADPGAAKDKGRRTIWLADVVFE